MLVSNDFVNLPSLARFLEQRGGMTAGRLSVRLWKETGIPGKSAIQIDAVPAMSTEEENRVLSILEQLNQAAGGHPIIKGGVGQA